MHESSLCVSVVYRGYDPSTADSPMHYSVVVCSLDSVAQVAAYT